MLLRKVAAVVTVAVVTAEEVMAAAMGVVTAAEGIFVAEAISAVMAAGILADGISAVADRLRGRVFAAIVLSQFITPDRLPYGH